nr:MAG: maturation protein [Sanya fiers-like virus 32]
MSIVYRTLSDTPSRAHYQHAYLSAPPFKPKAYWMSLTTASGYDARFYNAESSMGGYTSQAANRAYERFKGKLGDSSSFGATLTAELNETVGMLTGTVLRAFAAAKCIKKLDFAGAARNLGIPYRERTVTKTRVLKTKGNRRRYIVSRKRVFQLPTGREVTKTLANGWLLWSYGVKPLAQDIYNGLDVLQRPLEYKQPVSGAGRSDSYSYVYNSPSGSSYKRLGHVQCRFGALVSCENPNLWLLDKMGLTNPVQWVLEAIPFSFVVDWFSNLSSVVGSLSGFPGMRLEDTWCVYAYHYEENDVIKYWNGTYEARSAKSFVLRRSTTIPSPKLEFAYERFSPQRGLNAVSLLVGFLPR